MPRIPVLSQNKNSKSKTPIAHVEARDHEDAERQAELIRRMNPQHQDKSIKEHEHPRWEKK